MLEVRSADLQRPATSMGFADAEERTEKASSSGRDPARSERGRQAPFRLAAPPSTAAGYDGLGALIAMCLVGLRLEQTSDDSCWRY